MSHWSILLTYGVNTNENGFSYILKFVFRYFYKERFVSHFLEIPIYVLVNVMDEEFTVKDLEVVFDLGSDGLPENEELFIDGEPVKIEELLEDNPKIEARINTAINHYIVNHEPEYLDCE